MNNRLHNAINPYQGDYRKVLCVCSAGILRSPTAAWVLSNPPYNYNTRSVGLDKDFALIPIDKVLISWADEIVCMTKDQQYELLSLVPTTTPVICLDIEDSFEYRESKLINLIKLNYASRS